MFQSLPVILLVVFICSQSFAMLPHEGSSWQREVKMAAEHDADHDINQFLWFAAELMWWIAIVYSLRYILGKPRYAKTPIIPSSGFHPRPRVGTPPAYIEKTKHLTHPSYVK